MLSASLFSKLLCLLALWPQNVFLLIMPCSLSCSGCKATNFTTQCGLTKHQSDCVAYKHMQKKKISNLTFPERVEVPITSTSGGPGFIDSELVEDVNIKQNIDEPKWPVHLFPTFFFFYKGTHRKMFRMNQSPCLNNIGPQVCLYEHYDSPKDTMIYLLMRLNNLHALQCTLQIPIVMESIVFTKVACNLYTQLLILHQLCCR